VKGRACREIEGGDRRGGGGGKKEKARRERGGKKRREGGREQIERGVEGQWGVGKGEYGGRADGERGLRLLNSRGQREVTAVPKSGGFSVGGSRSGERGCGIFWMRMIGKIPFEAGWGDRQWKSTSVRWA